MKRLTYRDEEGTPHWCKELMESDTSWAGELIRSTMADFEDATGDCSIERLQELVQADKEGRVQIIPVCKGKECGACQHFQRISGTKRGKCEVKPYVESRCVSGKFPFEPSQSRKACLKFMPLKEEE